MRTLQFYVARELAKTFALTAIGLTMTFSLCGGVMNMVKAELLSAFEVFQFLGFLVPVAMSLTLPVSALFACAMVYGRLAADNEFDACRASGINIHRLLMPAVILSILTALFSFSFTNYVIPESIRHMTAMVKENPSKILNRALAIRGHLEHRSYVLTARDTRLQEIDQRDLLELRHITFMELKRSQLVRCGTAKRALLKFRGRPQDDEPLLQAWMQAARFVDLTRPEVAMFQRLEEVPFARQELPTKIKQEPKWLTLDDLIYYRKHPTELLPIDKQIQDIRQSIRQRHFYRKLADALTGPGEQAFSISRGDRSYAIRAKKVQLDPTDLTPELTDVTATYEWKDESGNSRKRIYESGSATVEVGRNVSDTSDVVMVTLNDGVTFRDAMGASETVEHSQHQLEPIALPETVAEYEESITDAELLQLSLVEGDGPPKAEELGQYMDDMDLGSKLHRERVEALAALIKMKQEVIGVLHSRLAFSASALVTLVLASAMGIIFRGGQFLTAFVISFVPGLVVVVLNIMGRHLSENTGTHLLGIGIMWAGIVALAVIDGVILTRYLKR